MYENDLHDIPTLINVLKGLVLTKQQVLHHNYSCKFGSLGDYNILRKVGYTWVRIC